MKFCSGFVVFLGFWTFLQAEPFYLVKDHQPKATIVIPDDPSLTESFAASELSSFLQKSTTAVLPIMKEKEAFASPSENFWVLIGGTRKTQELGVTLKGITKGGFLVKRTGPYLIFWGEDDRTRYRQGKPYPVDPKQRSQTRHGTLFAVYDFLEKNLGVRWYWPGSLGEIVPSHASVYVDNVDYRENPDFEYRFCYGYWLDDPDFQREESSLWWRRQRLGGAGYAPATHSFASYVARYGQTHPEYFALQKDGKRLLDTTHGGHICLSNKEFQKILIEDIINTFRAHPDIYTISVMPGDSFERYCCQCAECRAKYEEAEKSFPPGHATFIRASGKHSWIVWEYVNEVAREVGKVFPDRYIGCCAYASYYLVPRNMKFEPNVAVTVCRGNADLYFWEEKDIQRSHAHLAEWAKNTRLLFTWEYPCAAQAYGNPVIFPHGVNQEVKRLKKSGVKGCIVEYTPSYEPARYGGEYTGWMRENLTTYVLFKSLWKVDTDVDKLVEEYCRDLYGPAAKPMKKFFLLLEEIWKNGNHGFKPYYENWSNIWTYLYSAEKKEKLITLLNQASKLAPEGIYNQRVKKTMAGFSVLWENR